MFENPNVFNLAARFRKISSAGTPCALFFYVFSNLFFIKALTNRILIYAFNKNLIIKKTRMSDSAILELPTLPLDMIYLEEPLESIEGIKLQKVFDRVRGTHGSLKPFDKNNSYHSMRLEEQISSKITEISGKNCDYFVKNLGIYKNRNEESTDILLLFEGSTMTLDDVLKLGKVFSVDELFHILSGFIKALSLLQYNGIAIRSICPKSILIFDFDGKKSYKFSEFGLLASLPKGQITLETSLIMGCIPSYSSPELLEYFLNPPQKEPELYNPFVSDVYALGLLAIRMLGYVHPRRLVQQGLFEDEEFLSKYERILPVFRNMMEKDPRKRFDFNQIESQIAVSFGTNLNGVQMGEKPEAKIKEKKYYEILREGKAEETKKNAKDLQSLYHYHRRLYEAYYPYPHLIKEAKFHLKKACLIFEEMKENSDKRRRSSIFHDEEESILHSPNMKSYDLTDEIFCSSRIGEIYLKLGDYKKSEFFLNRSLHMCEKHFGVHYEEDYDDEHKNTEQSPLINSPTDRLHEGLKGGEYFAWSYSKLGLLYKEEGNLEKSESFFMRAFKILNRIYGDSCEEISEIKANLGDLYFLTGNAKKAEEYYHKSLEIVESLFGINHEITAEAYERLGLLYDNLGNLYKHQEMAVKVFSGKDEALNSCLSLPAESKTISRNIRNLAKAEELYQKSLRIRLEVNPESSKIAETYNNLGLLYDYLGDFHKAEENLQKALEIRLKVFGTDHPSTATTYNNLGLLSFNLGNYQTAEDLYNKALGIRLEKFGEKHSETATSYNNLGLLYEAMRNYKRSKENLSRALRIFRNLFGENHGGTATSYNNLGLLCESMGRLEKAEEYYLKSLKIREFLYGKQNGDTATSYNNLGALYYTKGELLKAEEYYLKAHRIFEGFYGENRGDTATSYNNLASLYEQMGDLDKAEAYYLKALTIRMRLFGENHKDTANSLNNLGVFYGNREDIAKAEEYYIRVLKVYVCLYGENHAETAGGYLNLAGVERGKGNYYEVIRLYLKRGTIFKSVYGEEHLETAQYYEDLGGVYEEMGEYEKAEENYRKSMGIWVAINGEYCEENARSLDNIGRVLEKQQNLLKAEESYDMALKVREKVHGENSENTAVSYYNLAMLGNTMEEYEKAEMLYNKVLSIIMVNSQLNQEKIADCYNQMGVLYSHMREFEKAEDFLIKCIQIRESLFKGNREGIIEVRLNLGGLYKMMGKLEEALENFEKVLEIQKEMGNKHNLLEEANSYTNIASIFEMKKEFSKAEENFLNALNIKESIPGDNAVIIAESYDNLGSMYENFNQLTKAEYFYLKSMRLREKANEDSVRESYKMLGGLYEKMGNSIKSQEFFEKEERRDSIYSELEYQSNNSSKDIRALCEGIGSDPIVKEHRKSGYGLEKRMSTDSKN